MKSLKKMLALVLVIATLIGVGSVAFAEGEVTADMPEISIEQPKAEAPKAEKPKAEEPKVEEPKIEVQAEIVSERPTEQKEEAAKEKAPAQEQASEAIEIGSDNADNGLTAEVEQSGETAETEKPAVAAETEQSAASDEIADETEELTTIEEDMVPLALRPATPFDGSVRIFASSNTPKFGEHVKLTSELKGFNGDYTLLFQWQINKGDGWRNISGANGRDFEFTYGERVQDCRWRLSITIDD